MQIIKCSNDNRFIFLIHLQYYILESITDSIIMSSNELIYIKQSAQYFIFSYTILIFQCFQIGMGNECMAQKKKRCHKCLKIVVHQGVCAQCSKNDRKDITKDITKNNNKKIISLKPILQTYPLSKASPHGDGLYPTNSCIQNTNESIYEKIPLNPQKTKFKWVKKHCWYYPPIIKNFQNTLMKTRTFQEKLLWFRLNMERFRISWQVGCQKIIIDRSNIIDSSLKQLENVNLYKQLKIDFNDQEVQDAGGLERQWMHLILKQVLNPENQVFVSCYTQQRPYKYKIDKNYDKQRALKYSKILGYVLGKAIFDRISINCNLNFTILRQLLGHQVYLNDFYHYDAKLYESYQSILQTKQADQLGLDFCLYHINSDETMTLHQLQPNGQQIFINEQNKLQYIIQSINFYCTKSIEPYLLAMKQSLHKVIPEEFLCVFEPHELEMIIAGPQFIDVNDWQANTVYQGYTPQSQVIKWYWQFIRGLDAQNLQNLLHYCTGTTRVPILGFKYLESNRNQVAKFTIKKVDYEETNPYPKSHTCFNRLELPEYKTFQELSSNMKVISERLLEHYGFD